MFIEPNKDHPAAPILSVLIANMETKQATDVHLREHGPVLARIRGRLQIAERWDRVTDKDGRFLPDFNYQAARDCLLQQTDGKSTVVYRLKTRQVRVQVLKDDREEKLLLRLQTRTPPPLEKILGANPKTQDFIAGARGLIVVCGPTGGGKTTLAASIANYLAGLHRHIVTLEDPVEYYLEPSKGEISQFTCRMTDYLPAEAGGENALPLESYIPHILRGDTDGLYIGETRTKAAIRTCLTFAATHEPVITTFQAGGITDALARLIVSAGEVVGQETARLIIAQCLEAILYVNLAFTKSGAPVPVVTCLPVSSASSGQALRNHISEKSPLTLASQVDSQLREGKPESGTINRALAITQAGLLQATDESVELVLPPDGKGRM